MAGVQVASGTFIAQNPQTVIRGQLTIGAGCVIHPTATIIADGPIVIGANNTIEELVTIINKGPDTMRIGDGNVFEVGSRIEASSLGNNNVVEPKGDSCFALENSLFLFDAHANSDCGPGCHVAR
eukprot:m.27854 g.27854  ORF g.27854 m.27854 type:complete len:125 (+) comp9045_c0_seq2:155-529(+)